jgi:hypothetical protein
VTSYSGMAARGREEARARTKGRRKVLVELVEEKVEIYMPGTGRFPSFWGPPRPGEDIPAEPGMTRLDIILVGACGHVVGGGTHYPGTWQVRHLRESVGKRITCQHEDCKIPPRPEREERADDCTWSVYVGKDDHDEDVERRCRTRATWHTEMGDLCTRHRDHLLTNGYLDEPGTEIERSRS